MNVLVTGGAGYIGSHMAWALADAGISTTVLDNLSTGDASILPPSVNFVLGNILDTEKVRLIIRENRIEAIFHFAAKTVVPESVAKPIDYYRTNTFGTHSLLDAAVTGGVSIFIFSSTAAVYGNVATTAPVSEDMAPAPVSPYGASKWMAERILVDTVQAHRLRHAMLRYFNVAGADPAGRTGQSTPRATHLIKTAVRTALGLQSEIQVFGSDYPTPDGTCVRDYIHVSDLVAAHMAAFEHLAAGKDYGLLLNCGYGSGFSVAEVLAAVNEVAGVELPVKQGPRRAGDPVSVVADNRRLRSTLDWTPRFNDLQQIIGHALTWERKLLEASPRP